MSQRLDQAREETLQPLRMASCKQALEAMGFEVETDEQTRLSFMVDGHVVLFWPYSGWHTGKSIIDGRGFKHLARQLHPASNC